MKRNVLERILLKDGSRIIRTVLQEGEGRGRLGMIMTPRDTQGIQRILLVRKHDDGIWYEEESEKKRDTIEAEDLPPYNGF